MTAHGKSRLCHDGRPGPTPTQPRFIGRGRDSMARRNPRKTAAGLNKRHLAWLDALKVVNSIDEKSLAGIVEHLQSARPAAVKRYYYIDLRGARGIAKVEATLKGG